MQVFKAARLVEPNSRQTTRRTKNFCVMTERDVNNINFCVGTCVSDPSVTLKTCVAFNSMNIDVAGAIPSRVKQDRNFAGLLLGHESDQLIDTIG